MHKFVSLDLIALRKGEDRPIRLHHEKGVTLLSPEQARELGADMIELSRSAARELGTAPPEQPLVNAALVIERTPEIRAWLEANDPKALAQLRAALRGVL